MYRVRVVVLYLPPLAERTGDVEALTWHFIREMNAQGYRTVERIAADAFDAMMAYPWPGNVRELRNNIEAAFATGEGPILTLDDLALEFRGIGPPVSRSERRAAGPQTVDDLERERLMDALRRAGGRKGRAAALLGISRSTLWRRLQILGLDRPRG